MVKISESDLPVLKKHIANKLSDYVKRDNKLRLKTGSNEETINTKLCIELIEASNGICEMCNCEMLFVNYTPFCLYQFTFDRLDETRVHAYDNLRIICYSCNSMGHFNVANKGDCKYGCHGNNEVVSKPSNYNAKWTRDDDILMFDSLLNNIEITKIASMLKRTERSIDKRLKRLFKEHIPTLRENFKDNYRLVRNLYFVSPEEIKNYDENDILVSKEIIELVMTYWKY